MFGVLFLSLCLKFKMGQCGWLAKAYLPSTEILARRKLVILYLNHLILKMQKLRYKVWDYISEALVRKIKLKLAT